MIAQISNNLMTPEEYLAFEEKSDIKHEYVNGEVFAMSGTTDSHNTIAINIAVALRAHLRGSGCRVFVADIKVQPPIRNYYYPDVFVTCEPEDREDPLSKRFPKLIVEVLSDSTEAKDRGDKFIDYQRIDSLEEYVLVNAKRKRVEVFRRSSGGLWVLQVYEQETEEDEVFVDLKSVDLKMPLSDVYEDVGLGTLKAKLQE
ncbi:MAG: Uma2 family endonuclease [Cyanobacteria bacterium J06560_6]